MQYVDTEYLLINFVFILIIDNILFVQVLLDNIVLNKSVYDSFMKVLTTMKLKSIIKEIEKVVVTQQDIYDTRDFYEPEEYYGIIITMHVIIISILKVTQQN